MRQHVIAATDAQKLASHALADQKLTGANYTRSSTVVAGRQSLSTSSQKKLLKELSGATRDGTSAASDERCAHEYSDIRDKIHNLCDQFHHNLQQERNGLWFTTEALSGMPQQHLASSTTQ